MHLFSRNKALIAASMAALGVLAACGDDVVVPPATVGSVVITLNPQNSSVNIGETITLSAQITGGSATTPPTLASCTSSNSAVLTTTLAGSACSVTGVTAGNASVTAKASTGQETSAAVTVNPQSAAISNLSVSPTSQNIEVGRTFTIVPNVVKGNQNNTVTYGYVSSTPGVATVNPTTGVVTAVAPGTTTITVTATGSGTGFTNAVLTQGVTVSVVNAPPSVTSVTVTPNNMSLALFTTGQISTNVSTAAGAPASTITYTSSNTSVASVTNAGVVSALAPGNATISVRVQNAGTATLAAYDATFTVPVNVAAQATVSLASLVQGPTITSYVDSMGSEDCDSDESAQAACDDVRYTGLVYMNNPNAGNLVDVNNVRDQVRLNVNLTTNGQRVDSIVIHIGDVNGANRRHAATQSFAGGQASNGIVFFDIRTDEFSVNTTTGVVDVRHKNGLRTFNATIFSTNAAGVVTSTQQALGSSTQYFFNNLDSWASVYVHPSRQAQGTNNANLNWHGGPGAEGEGRWSIYPVFYTAGRSVQTVSTGMGFAEAAMNGAAIMPICSSARTFTTPATAGLMQVTYGAVAATATRVNCAGFEHPATDARNLPYVINTIDNANNSAPAVTIVGGYRFQPQIVPQPVAIRLDYAGPSVVAPTVIGAEGFNWVNAAWSFTPGGTKVTDAGVGPLEATWRAFASANGGSTTTFPTQIATGADLAETNQNCTGAGCDGYNARATATDALGNVANSNVTAAFGDDKTATLLRYSSAATAPASSSPMANIYNQQGTSSTLDSVAGAPNNTYNAVVGLYGVNVATAGAQQRYLGTAATTGNAADSMRIEALDNRSGLSRAVVTSRRFAQGGATGTSVNTGCQTTTGAFGASFVDGWRPGPQVHVTCGSAVPGYYTTTMWAVDRAGNVSGSIAAPPSFTLGTNPAVPGANNANLYYRRTLALDPGQPQITGVSPNNNYTGNSVQTWSLGSQDDLEVIDARLRIQYPNVTIGDGAATASPGLVWSYALSNTMMPAGQGFSAGPASGTGANFGFFTPIATRFDASIMNPQVSTLTQDRFTLNVQETCIAANSPVVAPTACAGAGDPIASASVAFARPNNLAVQVRDVFGSWIFNTTPSAVTGVSTEFVSPILPATVAAPGGYSVGYSVVAPGCPQFGGAPGGPCVTGGINFRADGAPAAAVRNFRMVQPLSVTLPVFNRIELYGLNAANEWVFVQRCDVPANINPAGGAQACGGGTLTGTDNGLERYWVVSFSAIPTTGFTQFRALGVNNSGFGLFSTRQP